MGLLGNGFEDPQSAAIMALAGNMVRGGLNGGFGGGLLAANEAYQGALDGGLKRADLSQQIKLRNLQLQQAQQQWALQQPLLQRLVSGLSGGGASASAPTEQSQPPTMPTPGGLLGSGTFGIPAGGQQGATPAAPASAAPRSGGMLPGVPDNLTQWTIATGGIGAVPALLEKFNQPTDFQKLLTAAGIDPASPQGQAMVAQQIKKQNNIPLQAGRAGAPMFDNNGNVVAMAPKIPDNAIPQVVGGRVVGVSPLPGAAQVEQTNSYASAAGKAQTKPITAYRGNQPVFTNELAASQGGDVPPQPGMRGNFVGDPANVAMAIAGLKDPQERANAQAAFDSQMRQNNGVLTPQPQLGAQQAANLSQEELSKKATSLMSDNAQVGTVISRLQNIKMLAPGAIAGGETSRRDYFNSLLALAGINGAEDAKTASDLVDKNSAQIVSALRMGQGGAGTDALQTLLGAANPNRHMTKEAIQEAADQLIASQKMIQAKAQMLQPHYLARDPVQYGQKEMLFDQNADPRIWQLENMPPQQQAAYVKSLPASVAADVLAKRRVLKSIGAIK
jgi:hypothetical protein